MDDFFSAIRDYLWAVFFNKWAAMFALLVGVDEFLEWMVPKYRARLDRMFFQETRRKILLVASLIFVFVAGFLVWEDERTDRLASGNRLSDARKEIALLKAQPRIGEEAQAKIDSLNQANQQLQQKVEELGQALERQTSPWVLTEDQKKKLKDALSKIPPGVTYKLRISVIAGCPQCSGYTNDLGEVWKKVPGWEAQGSTDHGLNPRLIGVNVVPDMEGCPPEELQFVMDALTTAEIKYGQAWSKGQLGSGCLVLVGSRPRGE